MKNFLKVTFIFFFLAILYGTVTASFHENITAAIPRIWPDPWFRATLIDTYAAFLTVYLWMAYKEKSWAPRLLWLIAILLLGTFAYTVYILIQIFKLKENEGIKELLLAKEDCS